MELYKKIIVIMCCCLCAISQAQYSQNKGKAIVIGTIDSLYSNILNEHREIWIHTPEDFNESEHYPVIYVLDANSNFYAVVGMLKRLLPWKLPKSIVVGIRNTDRTRDFTPTHVPFHRSRKSETSGGASNFMEFVNKELKPYINKTYPTENLNTVIGHSLAGLFVLYAYLNNEAVFDHYIAIDPSLWWDNENLVKASQDHINNNNYNEKSLYVAVANSLGKSMDTLQVRKDRSVITEQIRANLKFHDILKSNSNILDFEWQYFKDEDHGSIVVPAQYKGIQSVFSWFPFPELWRFNTPNKYTVEEMINPYYTHYKTLSRRMKREIKPDWALVNDIGLLMIEGTKSYEKALAFHQMNLDFYPHESKSYVALGDFYLSQKEIAVAKAYYKKAIEIDGNQQASKQLEQLKQLKN